LLFIFEFEDKVVFLIFDLLDGGLMSIEVFSELFFRGFHFFIEKIDFMPFIEQFFPHSLILLHGLGKSGLQISYFLFLVIEKIPGGEKVILHQMAIVLCRI
jgi:hypothetical protein